MNKNEYLSQILIKEYRYEKYLLKKISKDVKKLKNQTKLKYGDINEKHNVYKCSLLPTNIQYIFIDSNSEIYKLMKEEN